jgi:hypothetical protein
MFGWCDNMRSNHIYHFSYCLGDSLDVMTGVRGFAMLEKEKQVEFPCLLTMGINANL